MQEAAAKALARATGKKPKTQASVEAKDQVVPVAPSEEPQAEEGKPKGKPKSGPKAKAKAKSKVSDAKKAADLEKAAEAASMLQDMYLKDCKPAAAVSPDFAWSEFKQVSFTCNIVPCRMVLAVKA